MDPELQDIEDALKALRPEGFQAAYLDRLTAAVEGRSGQLEPALQQVERSLAAMMPQALSAELSDSCLKVVSRVPFPVGENVVLFPGASRTEKRVSSRRPWWMAAAAVAVAGAFSATFVGPAGKSGSHGGELAATSPRVVAAPVVAAPSDYSPSSPGPGVVPASQVQEAKDEGVVWNAQGNPVRMVRVVYIDTVKLLDKDGKIIEVQRPREEYIAVPEKVD